MARATIPAPEPPAGLSPEAESVWRTLAAERAGRPFTAADLAALRRIVDVSSRLAEVKACIDAEGVSVAGSKGQRRGHPLLATEARLREELAKSMAAWEQGWRYRL